MSLEQLIATAITYVPAGLALVIMFWVLWLAISGRLHFNSEVDGLRQDKIDLLAINKAQSGALDAANKTIAEQNEIIREGLRNNNSRSR